MEYLPFILIAVLALFMAMPLYVWLGSKRMEGREAPELNALLTEEQRGMNKLLFYFYSEHCGPCRAVGPVVDAVAARHGCVVKVDVMQDMATAHRFGVRATPTVVLVEDGRLVKVLLGTVSEQKLELLLR